MIVATTTDTPVTSVIQGKGGMSPEGWHHLEPYLRCPKEYQYARVRKIEVPIAQTPEALAVGTLFHAARARWFSLEFAHDDAAWASIRQAMVESAAESRHPVSVEAEQRATAIFNEYVNYYKGRPLPKPIAAEYLVGPTAITPGGPTRTARLDDVSYYPEALGRLCIGEAKTCSDVNGVINQYELHGQPLLQALLWKLSPQGEAMHGPISGVILDIVRKPYGKVRIGFSRYFVPINDRALAWHAKSLSNYIAKASELTWDSDADRNAASCTRMVGRMRIPCQYRDLCRHGREAAGNYVTVTDSGLAIPLKSWEPSEGKETAPWE